MCQQAIVDRREGEKKLEAKDEELAALRNEFVDLMRSEGGLKEVR